MNHDAYADAYLHDILNSVKTVAMVGASPNSTRASYFVLKYLKAKGFRVIPINPRAAGQEILGETVYPDLASVPVAIDMVDIFRGSDAAAEIVDEALSLTPRPKAIWMQFHVRNDEAAARAEAGGMKVVMNRCPKVEWARLSGELSWSGFNTGVISSKRPKGTRS